MRPGSAEIQPPDWSSVPGPPQERAKREELVERVLAMKNVPACQAVGLLQIQGRQDLAMNNNLTNIRRIFRKGFKDGICKFASARIPVAAPLVANADKTVSVAMFPTRVSPANGQPPSPVSAPSNRRQPAS